MGCKFVSIGVTLVDFLAYPVDALPANDHTELIQKIRFCAAGTAAAPAVIAARHGLDTTLIGAVGKDDVGHLLLQLLQREGIDLSLVQERDDMPTAATMLPIDSHGQRPNLHMPGAFLLLEPNDAIGDCLAGADHIHWGGVGLLFNFDGEVAAGLLERARDSGATVTADLIAPNDNTPDAVRAIAPQLDWFMPSIDEALHLAAVVSVEAAADVFMEQGARGCVIKCGSAGAYIADQSGLRETVPVVADVNVVDTSGCGDSFCAGFNVGLASGYDPVTACRFAAATAAQVAAGLGSDGIVVDFDTTEKIMRAGSMSVLQE